jgi:predicted PurR-regulated permease PerM
MASSRPPLTEPGQSGSEQRRHPGVALAVLAGVWAAFAVSFFHVVRPLALPLFLTAVFAIPALPPHERLTAWCGRRNGLSALLIVVSLILLLLGPTTAGFVAAYRRASEVLARFEHTGVMPDKVDDLLDRIAVLHGAAGMHPLLAIVSVLGGFYQMGLLGVFVGPVVAGVFLAPLRILTQEFGRIRGPAATRCS